jgi:hypothetical protein
MDRSPQRSTQHSAPTARHERGLAAFARISADWFWETDPDGRFTELLGGSGVPGLDLPRRIGRTRREGATQDPEYGEGDPDELARTRYKLIGPDELHDERLLKHGVWIEARGVPVPGSSRLATAPRC